MKTTELLITIRTLEKLHSACLEEIRKKYLLSKMEISIISFLHNNPKKDTAQDIAALRKLPKGNVSIGVESLIRKNLLKKTIDKNDRRKQRLELTPLSLPIVKLVEQANSSFYTQVFQGFSEEEIQLFISFNERILQNTKNISERTDR